MSNTRIAESGQPLRQERWCSSEEIEQGLLANIVARRCSVLDTPKERELIWALQHFSHQPGGLRRVASDLVAMFPGRLGTKSMQRFGMKPGRVYNVNQIKLIRKELGPDEPSLPLRGDVAFDFSEFAGSRDTADDRPTSYRLEDFWNGEKITTETLPGFLEELCLNPALPVADCHPWFFQDLIASLWEYLDSRAGSLHRTAVVTEIGTIIYDSLDYVAQSKCLVLIEGAARTGKTFAAKQYVAERPGRARYVQVPSTNDDIGFFRAIAKALGVSCGRSWKAVQLRQRIEDVLQTGDLILVMDEAHFCFPVSDCRHSLPGRVNWVLTALVNQGVGVAFFSTPQFTASQEAVKKRTHWASEQLIGRITHYERLPEILPKKDLAKVARSLLPEGDSDSIQALAKYANTSAKYLAGIESAVRRARYLAQKDGREKVTASDIQCAIRQGVIPSDTALAQALAEAQAKGRGKRFKGALTAPQSPISATEESDAPAASEPICSDRNKRGILDIRSLLRAPQAEPEPVTT